MELFARTFATPDETMRFPNGSQAVISFDGSPVRGMTLQPGWRWSNDVRSLAGADSCPLTHEGYMLSGNLHVEMDDGSALDIGPNQVFRIPPGHDAWVSGDDVCSFVDWGARVASGTHAIGGAA